MEKLSARMWVAYLEKNDLGYFPFWARLSTNILAVHLKSQVLLSSSLLERSGDACPLETKVSV